jgi:hypothetical protein
MIDTPFSALESSEPQVERRPTFAKWLRVAEAAPQKDSESKGWRHYSEVSERYSYTGKGGSKRD